VITSLLKPFQGRKKQKNRLKIKNPMKLKLPFLLGFATTMFIGGWSEVRADSGVSTRPLNDWLVAQTSEFGWSDPYTSPLAFIFVDYAGRWANFLGLDTTVEGTVKERVQRDGTTLVSVQVHLTDALCYGLVGGQLVFGHTIPQLHADPALDAGLATCNFKLDFISNLPPGSPLPSLTAIPNSRLVKLQITAEAIGTFRAASGYPEGTPATAQVTEVGLYSVPSKGAGAPGTRNDYFPAEHVHFEPIGE
jgi:hypothetical protein